MSVVSDSGFSFDKLLGSAVSVGEAYLKNEIADHGNQAPTIRPDTEQVPSKTVVATASEEQTAKMYTIAGIAAAVLVVVVLIFKK